MRKSRMTTVAVVIAAIGLTTAPARADQNDIAKVIVGLAGVAALAAIISDREKNREKAKASRNQQLVLTPNYKHQRKKERHARKKARNIDYNQCLRQRWTQAGWETFVSNRCVSRLQAQARRGPHWNQGRYARR